LHTRRTGAFADTTAGNGAEFRESLSGHND